MEEIKASGMVVFLFFRVLFLVFSCFSFRDFSFRWVVLFLPPRPFGWYCFPSSGAMCLIAWVLGLVSDCDCL